MIDTQIVADYLTNFFNDNQENITFYFYAEVGKSEYKANVTGMVTTESSKLPPVNLKNGLYTFYVGLVFGVSLSNNFFIKVKKIVEDKLSALNGTAVQIGNGKGFITVTLPSTGDFKIDRGVGSSVPMTITMTINYTEDNVLLPKSKHWLLDGKEINYVSESLSVNKNGKINPINSRNYNQTLLMSQTRYYHFKLYNDTSDLCSMLQKDLLDGELNKTYTLTYFDGKNFTEANPFETKVLIYNSGNSLTEVPNTPMFDLTFIDADDGKNEVKYQMALIDNPFDAQTENVRWFASQDEQINYYLEKVVLGADFDDIPAPNINSLYLTSQIYLNTRKYDIFDLINKNFAIIKATKGEIINYFYYRVLKGEIGANGQVIYDLKLDSIQTYLFNPNLEIKGTFINKAHLDRWIDNGDGTVSFNGKADSKLFEREEIRNVAKRLVAREKLKYYSDNPDDQEFLSIFNDTSSWVYIYLAAKSYNILNKDGQQSTQELNAPSIGILNNNRPLFNSPSAILCFPITNLSVYRVEDNSGENDEKIYIDGGGLQSFIDINGEEFWNFVHSIKISIKPPFLTSNINYYNPTIVADSILSFSSSNFNDNMPMINRGRYSVGVIRTNKFEESNPLIPDSFDGLFVIQEDYIEPILMTTNITMPQITFNKSDIIGADKNKNYNPKINSDDYKSLTLTIAGNSFNYSISKLNVTNPIFEYFEPLTSDVTKGLLRYRSVDDNSVFNSKYSTSFNGFSYTNDFSIGFATTAYGTFIANNKNAYLSFQNQQQLARNMQNIDNRVMETQMITSAGSGLTGIMGSIATGDVGGSINGALSTAGNAVNQYVNYEASNEKTNLQLQYNQTQFDLTVDNMKNSPDSLQNVNGNAILNYMVADFGIYAEIYEGLDTELEAANDIMFRDGYNLNRFGEIENYIHIRKYFNYIKAFLGNISGVPMSESARADLKQRFVNGIRFWTTDDIDYTKENYEIWLENNSEI